MTFAIGLGSYTGPGNRPLRKDVKRLLPSITNKNPTGRIPGTVMRFKIDNNFLAVCRLHPEFPEIKPATAISEELAAAFLDAGLFKDDESNYGETFIDVAGCNQMFSILDILTKYCGVGSIRPETWDALCASVLLGDGDCPECGGVLRFLETDGHKLNDGDRWTPDTYEIDYYIYKCANCGEIIKSKHEL